MSMTDTEKERFMAELIRLTKSKTAAQVSMFDVGAAMGLEKEKARRLAEDLIADGMVEIKTLSGGIGITAQGLASGEPCDGGSTGGARRLGQGLLLSELDRKAVEAVLMALKQGIFGNARSYARLEQMVIDMKTVDLQLLSPSPKTAVIREVLRSLQEGLKGDGAVELAGRVEALIGA